jgi:hypothetical protein
MSLAINLARDLQKECGEVGLVTWSKHLKHDNPNFSTTFNSIVQRLADYFDVEVYASRLNFYRDGAFFFVC